MNHRFARTIIFSPEIRGVGAEEEISTGYSKKALALTLVVGAVAGGFAMYQYGGAYFGTVCKGGAKRADLEECERSNKIKEREKGDLISMNDALEDKLSELRDKISELRGG